MTITIVLHSRAAPSLDLLTCFDFDLCLTPKLEECLPPFDNLTCSIEELYIFKKKMKKISNKRSSSR